MSARLVLLVLAVAALAPFARADSEPRHVYVCDPSGTVCHERWARGDATCAGSTFGEDVSMEHVEGWPAGAALYGGDECFRYTLNGQPTLYRDRATMVYVWAAGEQALVVDWEDQSWNAQHERSVSAYSPATPGVPYVAWWSWDGTRDGSGCGMQAGTLSGETLWSSGCPAGAPPASPGAPWAAALP